MSVWIIEKTASGKVIPLRELVYCSECVHRSVGVCLLKAMFTDGDDFCKHGKLKRLECIDETMGEREGE